jgi:hypothetical protein
VTGSVDRLVGIPDIAVLIKNLMGAAAALVMIRLNALLPARPGSAVMLRRLGYGILAVSVVGMAALFAVVPRDSGPGDFVDEQAHSMVAVGYGCLAQLALAIGAVAWLGLFSDSWRSADPIPRRTGLGLLKAGAAVGLVYIVNRMTFLLTHGAGISVIEGPAYVIVSRTLFAVMMLLLAAGSGIPILRQSWRGATRYAALNLLRPLWRALYRYVPDVVLGKPSDLLADMLALREVDRRLYRRVIEIRDAQWLLRARVPGPVVAQAMEVALDRGLRGERAQRAAEAYVLRAALTVDPRTLAPTVADEDSVVGAALAEDPLAEDPLSGDALATGDGDLDSEARALLVIAWYFWAGPPRREPFVRVPTRSG